MKKNTPPAAPNTGLRKNSRHSSFHRGENEKDCSIKQICQSCAYVNDDYKDSLNKKHQRDLGLFKAQNLMDGVKEVPPVASPHPLQYRTTMKLAVRAPKIGIRYLPPTKGRFEIGLFKPTTHDIVDLTSCPLHAPVLKTLLIELKEILEREERLTPWDEGSLTGSLRYIVAKASHITDEVMITFVTDSEKNKQIFLSVTKGLRSKGLKVNSHININPHNTNQIFGEKTVHIAGNKKLRESLCDLQLELSSSSFLQANPWQATNIYRRLSQLISPHPDQRTAIAWDLYCGVGIISLMLSRSGYKVVGIEENPDAIGDAIANSERNGLSHPHLHFMADRVEDAISKVPPWATHPKIIVMNPSRRGLDESVRKKLANLSKSDQMELLLYISCDINSLIRDLKDLTQSHFKLRQLEAYDMFAQTDKLEWLAVLTP